MGRVMAIDYGLKRTGLAVSDPLRIIATPLETVATEKIFEYLKSYCSKEPVDQFVVGMPRNLKNEDSAIAPAVRKFITELKALLPHIPIEEADERFTSSMAQRALIDGGMKKKDRQKKENVDRVSAAIILQSFLYRIG